MDVAQGEVVVAPAEVLEAQGVEGADFGVVALGVAAADGHMGGHYHGQPFGVEGFDIVLQGDCHFWTSAGDVGQGDDEALGEADDVVFLPAVDFGEVHRGLGADESDAGKPPHLRVAVEARGGVVVAGHDDDVEVGERAAQGHEAGREGAHGRGGGLLDVEDVAADHQRVGAMVGYDGVELAEEVVVLVGAVVVSVDDLAKVEVGGV